MTVLIRSIPRNNTLHGQVTLATVFACLTALSARIEIPINLVPVTLQVLFALLSGLVLGSKLGALSQLEYLAFGLAGVPVFAQGKSGLIALLGPTGGYLIGFVLAAYLAGMIAETGQRPGRLRFFLASLVGTAGIYLFGFLWLAAWLSLDKGTPWVAELENAWHYGVLPFILVDGGKAILASGVALSGRAFVALLR